MRRAVPLRQRAGPRAACVPAAPRLLQRACACGNRAGPSGSYPECTSGKRVGTPPLQTVRAEAARLDRLATPTSGHPAAVPENVYRTPAGGGGALDVHVRRDMEARFGHDFSAVRIHGDNSAARFARDVEARAYAAASSIVFAAGQSVPHSPAGRRLLAHELTHVVQQGRARALSPDRGISWSGPSMAAARDGALRRSPNDEGPDDAAGADTKESTAGAATGTAGAPQSVCDPKEFPRANFLTQASPINPEPIR